MFVWDGCKGSSHTMKNNSKPSIVDMIALAMPDNNHKSGTSTSLQK